jgi:hypothetical protein
LAVDRYEQQSYERKAQTNFSFPIIPGMHGARRKKPWATQEGKN